MQPARKQHVRSAFSLIELLIVVAIIALLASLLLPTLARAKFSGQNTRCRANLRQLHLSLMTYTAHHSAFPLAYAFEKGWWSLLTPQAQLSERRDHLTGVYLCPFQKPIHVKGQTNLPTQSPLSRDSTLMPWSSYGYNAFGAGSHQDGWGLGGRYPQHEQPIPTLDSEIVRPSEMIALADGFTRSTDRERDGRQNAGGEAILSRWALYYLPGYPVKQQPTYRAHRGRFNRIFVDGHFETEDFNKRVRPTADYVSRWNKDHQPHADPYWLQ